MPPKYTVDNNMKPDYTSRIQGLCKFFRLQKFICLQETTNFMRDGWCYTGDKGYYDTDENVFVIGRYKELIKYRMAHVSKIMDFYLPNKRINMFCF